VSYRDILKPQLKIDEGVRVKPYVDTVGKQTIGVGRNLTDIGLRADEVEYLLENDVNVAEATAKVLFPSFDQLSDNRKAVLVNMAFNMGQVRLAGFAKLRERVAAEDFDGASREMLNSGWASQVGNRAVRLATMMRQG
jgi:lysozyme